MHDDDHGQGTLARDLQTMLCRMDRRQVLRVLAAASLVPVVGCGEGSPATTTGGGSGGNGTGGTTTATGGSNTGGKGGTGGSSGSTSTSTTCEPIPSETAGPYPGDGTNGANALTLTGIVRSDITSSIAGSSGVAEGVPLTVELTIVDASSGCAALAGFAVYIWHCDREGAYSMYTGAATGENYLRGVQETDEDGKVTFTSIFPGCYSGRWPHIHFEVYSSLASATSGASKVAVSQLAFPEDSCDEVYTTAGYEQSMVNLQMVTLAGDSVFSDGSDLQLAPTSGSVGAGYTAKLTVAITA